MLSVLFAEYFIVLDLIKVQLLLLDVVRATNRGVAVTRNVSSEPNWSFGQSFFFAGTVVTTIGLIVNLFKINNE